MDLIKNKDISVDLYFGPEPPKGWNMLFRLYGPLQSWFDKTWRPGDFERIK
jgi:hypothetical protein